MAVKATCYLEMVRAFANIIVLKLTFIILYLCYCAHKFR